MDKPTKEQEEAAVKLEAELDYEIFSRSDKRQMILAFIQARDAQVATEAVRPWREAAESVQRALDLDWSDGRCDHIGNGYCSCFRSELPDLHALLSSKPAEPGKGS